MSICFKCSKCCPQSACRGQTSKFLGKLVKTGCQSESGSDPKGRLHSSLSDPAKTHKVSLSRKLLCQSPEEQLPTGGITSAYRQKCSGSRKKQKLFELFQQTFSSSQTKQQVASYSRPQPPELISQNGEIQNGDTGDHQSIPSRRGVGNFHRLQRCLLPHSNSRTIQKVPEVSRPGANIPVLSVTLRPVNSTFRVHCSSKGVETDGHFQGYKDPPIPRRLVGPGQIPPSLSPAYPGISKDMPRIRLAGELGQIGTGTQADIRFRRLPVRPQGRPGPAYSGPVGKSSREDSRDTKSTDLSG